MDQEDVTSWIEGHGPLIIIGGVIVAVFIIYQIIQKQQHDAMGTQTSPSASGVTSDLSGLQVDANGNPVVYVPTETIFRTTTNIGGNNTVNSPTNTTTSSSSNTSTVTIQSPPATPTGTPPPTPPPSSTQPSSNPPIVVTPVVHAGGRVWDQRYTVKSGDTLSGIAAGVQNYMIRYQGAPSNVTVTANDLYSHNQTTINAMSAAHGNPIQGYATPVQMNNIFPGEVLTTPRWDKTIN